MERKTKKFIIEVEEGETMCDDCPLAYDGGCPNISINEIGFNCDNINFATITIKEYENND